MNKLVAALAVVAVVAALLYFGLGRGETRKQVAFAKVARQPLVSTIVTNGKIEPSGYVALRAPRDGSVVRIAIERGQRVRAGQLIAELDCTGLDAELRAAESRITQARAELRVIELGGSTTALTDIENSLASARLELEQARREREKISRLVEKQAETRDSLAAAEDRVRLTEVRIEALNRSRSALGTSANREPVEARLREAQAARALASERLERCKLQAPTEGEVYNLAIRPGAFVHTGDLIVEIGRTGQVNAVVYVDEPELGRVAKGMRVKITWDAMPERTWEATVDKLPTQIVPLNSRQVGEVICTLDNTGGVLEPGANVNAEIISREVPAALSIPKAALRREGGATGVLVLKQPENRLEWRPVEIGISSITHAQVARGLQEGELVALPGSETVAAGDAVEPLRP